MARGKFTKIFIFCFMAHFYRVIEIVEIAKANLTVINLNFCTPFIGF